MDDLLPNEMLYIAHDRRLEEGGMLRGERLSRPMRRNSVARRVLKRVRRHHPAAYVLKVGVL